MAEIKRTSAGLPSNCARLGRILGFHCCITSARSEARRIHAEPTARGCREPASCRRHEWPQPGPRIEGVDEEDRNVPFPPRVPRPGFQLAITAGHGEAIRMQIVLEVPSRFPLVVFVRRRPPPTGTRWPPDRTAAGRLRSRERHDCLGLPARPPSSPPAGNAREVPPRPAQPDGGHRRPR